MKRFYYFMLGFSIGGLIAYFVPPHSFEGFIIGIVLMLVLIFSDEVKENEK